MKKIAIIILILACMVLLTCRGVLYDADIMAAAMLSSRLHEEATIGPVTIRMDNCMDYDSKKMLFIPDKTSFTSGYFILLDGDRARFKYIAGDGRVSGNEVQMPLNGYMKREPNFLAETILNYPGYIFYINYFTTSSDSLSYYNFVNYDSYSNTVYLVYSYYPTDYDLDYRLYNDFYSYMNISANPNVNGAYIAPENQSLYILCSQVNSATGTYTYFDVSYVLDATSIYSPGMTYMSPYYVTVPISEYPYDLYYFRNLTQGTSWLSYPVSNDTYENYAWSTAGGTATKYSFQQPMHEMLTTSEFLSFSGNMAQLCSMNGKVLHTFPYSDDLYFAYEVMDTTGAYDSIITQVILLDSDECSSIKCSIRVYSYPTAKLGEL